MDLLALSAVAFTAALVALLCLGDPKRRRAYGRQGRSHSNAMRRALVIAALMPGAAYALAGDAAAFFIWFGGSSVAGWCIALLFAGWTSGDADTNRY